MAALIFIVCDFSNFSLFSDVSHSLSMIPYIPLFFPQVKANSTPVDKVNSAETKKATFAMKISVEHNKRTGKNQVVSTTTICPESIQESGQKVYDDGRKSVYALQPEEDKVPNGVVREMSSTEVEELLHQATDKTVPAEVHYHHPVYSVPYTGNSRSSTPRVPTQIHLKDKTQFIHDQQDQKSSLHQNYTSRAFRPDEEANFHWLSTVQQINNNMDLNGRLNLSAKTTAEFPNNADTSSAEPDGPVPVTLRSKGLPASMPPIYRDVDQLVLSLISGTTEADETLNDFHLHAATESTASVNLINTLPEDQEEEAVTMIFIGYENALDEEEEDIQAELVILGDNEGEDDDKCLDNMNSREECLSYHPEGCKSKIFQPTVEIAKVAGGGDAAEDTYTNWRDLKLHKPTFIHKPGKHSCYTQGQSMDEPPSRDCIDQVHHECHLCYSHRLAKCSQYIISSNFECQV
ncbi:palmdelphin isoform X1 [Fundulus heteroclitus]|uniref:palmdelphin isoform X1 n=2 Tax=Fundulus heteroclitus TaxID=8078 RepID=UPI00165BD047|nr:palmdelphin isoform X1 [Fundulus heteroclitus]